MPQDDYPARLQRQRETIGRRLETARDNVAALETECDELEVALRVHKRIAGDVGKAQKNGAGRESNLSQGHLIFSILDDAIPNRLSIRDICRIAKERHGRDIPVQSAASVLSSAKKKGRVINRDRTWSTKPEEPTAPRDGSPVAVSSDGLTEQS